MQSGGCSNYRYKDMGDIRKYKSVLRQHGGDFKQTNL
jgi:hypothetical protein